MVDDAIPDGRPGVSARIDPATGKPMPRGVTYRGPKQYQTRKVVDGRRVQQTFSTAALARRWLTETSAKAELGQFQDTRPLDTTTISDLVTRYAAECMSDREADRTGHIPAILRDSELPGVKLSRFSPSDVRGFRDRMVSAGYAPGTVVKRMNLLAAVIQHAIGEWDVGIINHASGRVVKRPEGADRKRNRRLVDGANGAESEFDRLIEAVTSPTHPDDVWLIRFAIEQGTRRGEAILLRWQDVDFERRTVHLGGDDGRTKTRDYQEERGLEVRPLTPGALRLLREKLATYQKPPKADAPVFDVGTGNAASIRIIRRAKKAGLADLTFHDLRHEATSRLARHLPNPLDLKRVTGHRDLKSLDRYYQPVPESLNQKVT